MRKNGTNLVDKAFILRNTVQDTGRRRQIGHYFHRLPCVASEVSLGLMGYDDADLVVGGDDSDADAVFLSLDAPGSWEYSWITQPLSNMPITAHRAPRSK